MAWHRIDYGGLWSSDKLSRCSDEAQADYAWVYGIADAWGCFELTNLRVVLGRVAPIRKKLSVERLEQDFKEYHDNGLCFTWEAAGKRFGYWTGSENRLPPRSSRDRYARTTLAPPEGDLERYVRSFGSSLPWPSRDVVMTGSRLHRDNGNVTGTVTEREQTHTPSRPAAEVCAPGPQPTELRFEGEHPAQPRPQSQRREIRPFDIPQPVEPTKESQDEKPEQLQLGQPSEEKPGARVLLEIYEQERGPLPAVREETPERLSKCRRRLLSHAKSQEQFLADFRAAVRKASQIAWPQWKPSFDWFIANDTNYTKVLEGNYDSWGTNADRNGATGGTPGRDFSGTDLAAEKFLRRVDEVAPKVGPSVLPRPARAHST